MKYILMIANGIKYLLNQYRRLFLYSIDLIKRRYYVVGIALLCTSLLICVILYMIGGWALVIAYLMCKLTGMCPI